MYLVTGPTGNVGSEVVRGLLAKNEQVRVYTRDPSKLAQWQGRVEIAKGEFSDAASFARALEGVTGVFLMVGADLESLLKAPTRPKVVFLSTYMASGATAIGKIHEAKENAIKECGLAYAFLRPGGFMSNIAFFAQDIEKDGVVRNPFAEGRFAPIAPDDIAAVAVAALTGATAGILPLTGGETVTVAEEVRVISEVLGRTIRCVDVAVEEAVQGLVASGVPAMIAEGVGESWRAVREGKGASIDPTFERLMGRPPLTFAAWAREHAARVLRVM